MLSKLWKEVDQANRSELMPILGAGAMHPRYMFVFINPTARNISSDRAWRGPRYPFIGTKQVWRIFHRANLFDNSLMKVIEAGDWTPEFALRVAAYMKKRGLYITNLVKETGADATLPDAAKIKKFLPLLMKEIEIVKPKYIVTMGLMPFSALARENIRLSDYYKNAMKQKKLRTYEKDGMQIVPCYFPIGRGNPKRAVDLLKLLKFLN